MHSCTLVSGYAAWIASAKPDSSSMQATKTSRSPRFFRSVRHGEPELGSFGFAEPQPEQFLVPVEIHAQGEVNRVLRDLSVRTADVHHDAVEIDNRPHRSRRPRPPGGRLGVEVGGDFRNQRGRDLDVVQLTNRCPEGCFSIRPAKSRLRFCRNSPPWVGTMET